MTSERITQPPSSGTILRIREPQRPLTVKWNGRAEAPDGRRGRILSSSARGAQPPTHHGSFQRLLEDALTQPTVRARFPQRKPCPRAQRNFSLNRSRICDKRS